MRLGVVACEVVLMRRLRVWLGDNGWSTMTEDATIFVLAIGLVELERRRGPAGLSLLWRIDRDRTGQARQGFADIVSFLVSSSAW